MKFAALWTQVTITAFSIHLFILLTSTGVCTNGQAVLRARRIRVGARTEPDADAAELPSESTPRESRIRKNESDEEPEEGDRRPFRRQFRQQGRAQGGRMRGGGGGRRPAGGGQRGGGGGQRQGGRGRQLGRRRRPRPRPAYYDYYYDEAYYYDDYYPYEYDDYDAEPQQAAIAKPPSRFQSTVEDTKETSSGSPDYGGIIRKLWLQFLKEKEGGDGSSGSRFEEKEEKYECPPQDQSYFEPDEKQCDKYYECNIKGEIKEHLCPDGLTFDITLEKCDYPSKVNCTGRPQLQEPQPSVNCSRANGFFPWPANVSCQNFWDCRQGVAYKQTCPVGVIFDPGLNACATPDQSTRTECTAGGSNFLNFTCPTYDPDSVLRFGNHDRLPHPEDCQLYYTCLNTGGARLATCPRKQVFNNATGNCGDGKEVPGCESYWKEKLKDDYDEYYYDYN